RKRALAPMIDEKDQQGWVFDPDADDALPEVDADVLPPKAEPPRKPEKQEQAAEKQRPASDVVEEDVDLGEALDELDVPTPVAPAPAAPPVKREKPAQPPVAAAEKETKATEEKPAPGFGATDLGRRVMGAGDADDGVDTSRPEHEQFYLRVLHTLAESEDL